MKRFINQITVAFAGLLVAGLIVSCQAKGTPSVLPEFKGDIKLDRTLYGIGQKASATYVVPTGGQNIESSDITWNYDDNAVSTKNIPKDGVSTVNFIVKGAAGEHSLEFVRQYVNLELGEAVTGRKSIKFNIVACDVFTSFWNDSKAVVLATANETFKDPNAALLEAPVKNILGKQTEIRQYHFKADKLDSVRKIVLDAQVSSKKALGYTNLRTIDIEQAGYALKSFDVIKIADGTSVPVDRSKINDKTYTEPISVDVENGISELRSILQNAKTKVILSYSVKAGVLLNVITYTVL